MSAAGGSPTPNGAQATLVRLSRAAERQARLIRRHVTGDAGAFALLYHRVDRPERDPWGLAVAPERFAEHLRILQRHAHPMPLGAFAHARTAGTLPRNAVAVTFDDGYVDNLRHARPALEAADVPATVFLATGYAGRGLPFWWDEVERLLLGDHPLPEELALDAGGAPFRRALAPSERAPRAPDADRAWRAAAMAPDPRQALYLEVWAWMGALAHEQRAVAVAELQALIASSERSEVARALTAAEVGQLAAGGLVDVGAHTVSHPMLPSLPPARQREEIVRSRAEVAALTNRPITAFSYPHGRRDAVTVRLVREAGFSVAGVSGASAAPFDCSRDRGDGLHVPRVSVRDWDAETFLRKLRLGFEV